MDFGYRSGKTRIDLKTIFGIKTYIDKIMKTGLKWVFIVGMLLGLFISLLIQATFGGILFIVLLMLIFGFIITYPIYLLMSVSGDNNIGNVFNLYLVNIIIGVIISVLPISISADFNILVGLASWVLAIGLVYPKKVTLVDSVAVLFIPSLVFILLLILIGGASISALIIGSNLTQSIMSII